MGNNIVKRVMVKCLPKDVTKPLAIHLDNVTTSQQIRKLAMRQLHDEMTGMVDGENTQFLYHVNQDVPSEQQAEDQSAQPDLEAAGRNWNKAEQEYWAAALGQKGKGGKGGKGRGSTSKGNGYGECWNRGQQGHPARECPVPGKLHGGVGSKDDSKGTGTAAAFKGKGKRKGNGSWKGGPNWKGKGKGPGKQSLTVATDVEYAAAWHDRGRSVLGRRQ